MGGCLSPASILYDVAGNAVGVIQDGSVYLLAVTSKIRNAEGSTVNPATEDTLDLVKTKTDNLDVALSTRAKEDGGRLESLDGKDFATETTLGTRAAESGGNLETAVTKLTSVDNSLDVNLSTRASEASLSAANGKLDAANVTLTSIKSTDGIKKITDELPAGTQEIGKVAQGTKGAGANAWPQVLYDASGNVVGVVQDDTVYRLQADAKIAKKVTSGALEHLRVLDDTGALKSTIYTPGGDPVNFPVAPEDASGIANDFLRQAGGVDDSDLRVDGSVTPVDFTFNADPTKDILVNEISVVMVANSIASGANSFAGLTRLTNGLHYYYYDGASELSIDSIHQNEDFMHFSSPGGYGFWALSKDQVLAESFLNGSIILRAGTTDKIILRVADDLDSGINYLKSQVKGVKRG